MKYKVHQAYITDSFLVIQPGIYEDTEIDILEARRKTTITGVNTVVNKESTVFNTMPVTNLNLGVTSKDDVVKVIEANPTISQTVIKRADFNILTEEELIKYKYVGKAVAEKVIKERAIKPFADYDDLDNRVPLKGGRKWLEVGAFEFNPVITQELELS